MIRTPAPAIDPGYPTLWEHRPDRRRALKLFALSSAGAALGLPLIGCPPSSGTPPSAQTPPPVPTTTPPSWLPWVDAPALQRTAGEMEAPPNPSRVAVVIGGGPIEATLNDGTKARLVVAIVVPTVGQVPPEREAEGRAMGDAEIVLKKAASDLTAAKLADAIALDAFEGDLRGALTPGWSRPIEEVSVGLAVEEPKQEERPREATGGAAQEPAPAREAAQEREEASPRAEPIAPLPARSAAPAPKVEVLWAPCRKPGCNTCKPR